ncbi:hypothetical protein EWH70_29835 [Amycolatopsis suaedae]|uniref:HTH luxR-type domain-containing protein n=2 Tax=Amycolatopsis suaedae TaxID=2510978 RepID=A0A4Q7J2W4_9PSEU|nr:hypothetical protein EWH70_29835 [Amycolatopsis suaedae]
MLSMARSVLAGADEAGLLAEATQELRLAPGYRVRAELRLGDVRSRDGDPGSARKHYRLATDLATRAGYGELAAVARGRLLAARGRLHRTNGSVTGLLTSAERRVAELAALGTTNREVADTLLVSQRTVEWHLTNIYRKLAVTGRSDLARLLGDSG